MKSRTKMKSLLTSTVLALSISIGLSACGGGGTTEQAPPDSSTETTTTTTSESKASGANEEIDWETLNPDEANEIADNDPFYKNLAISGKDVLNQRDKDYFVYFYMPTCEHCQRYKPVLTSYEKQKDALPMYKVNLLKLEEEKTWDLFKIEGTPTLIRVQNKDGQNKEVWRSLGVRPLEALPKEGTQVIPDSPIPDYGTSKEES